MGNGAGRADAPAYGRHAAMHYMSHLAPLMSAETAGGLYELLLPTAGVWSFSGQEIIYGSSHIALARYARRVGRLDDAIRHHEQALHAHEIADEVPIRAHIEIELAEALLDRDRGDDAHRARALATTALDVANAIGLEDVQGRAHTALLA